MREVFGEILEKFFLIFLSYCPFMIFYTLQMQYLGKYKFKRLGTFNS